MAGILTDYNKKNAEALKNKKLFLLDMDGTLYNDNAVFDGTHNFLRAIKRRGARYMFITNNSSKSTEDYVKKLKNMGITATEADFFTSAMAAADLMKTKFGSSLIYAEGTKSFISGLRAAGVNVTEEYDESVSAILLGFDTEITFEKLSRTAKMLTNVNVPYYATHPDYVCPVEYGFVPDLGSVCFGLEKATGRTPVYIGKPQPTMIYSAMKLVSVTRSDTVVVGDRLYTDIKSGINAGVDTICVLSGEATYADISACDAKPTYVFADVGKILI